MTADNTTRIIKKYKRRVSKDYIDSFRTDLSVLPDDYAQSIMSISTKHPGITAVLSMFLGGLAIDRFYLGDTLIAIIKLSFRFITLLCPLLLSIIFAEDSFMYFVGEILRTIGFVAILWGFLDIYYSRKDALEINTSKISSYIHLLKNK